MRANNLVKFINVVLESSVTSSSNPRINNEIMTNTKYSETINSNNPYATYPSVSNFIPPTASLTEDNIKLDIRLLDIFAQISLSDNKKVSIELEEQYVSCLSKITNSLDFGRVHNFIPVWTQ